MKEELKKRGVTFQYYHCSNSAGIIDLKEANMDIVTCGYHYIWHVSIR